MKARIMCLTLMMYVIVSAAQEKQHARSMVHPWEQYLNEVMTAEDVESNTWEQTCELLCELEQSPLDINLLTREQLEELPFLSALQIEELIAYLDRYGPMKSLSELQMIRSIDYSLRRLLSCFLYVDEQQLQKRKTLNLKDAIKYGRSELMATGRIPFYERKGDKGDYLGYPYRHWLRYQFSYNDLLKIGLLGSQDAGEPFFKNRNRLGYDYYSFYLQLRNLGRLTSLTIGKYRTTMGMGLIANNGFSLGKMSMLQTLGRPTNTIKAHSSRSDTYLQGAAATLNIAKGLTATALVSYRAMDATLNTDGTVSTILTSNYHRTEKEMEKKHNLHATKLGGNLNFRLKRFHFGANMLYTHFDRKLQPDNKILYRQHYAQGNDFINASLDYGYTSYRFTLNGETAIDRDGHLATIHALSLKLGSEWSMTALQRFYSYSYVTLDGNSYSEGGKVQNESGIYLGLTWQPSPAFRLMTYADYAYFAWAKYLISQSSSAFDYLLQGTLQKQRWTLEARYRLKMKQRDEEDKKLLYNRWEHHTRLRAVYATDNFGWTTQLDASYHNYKQSEWGAMLSGKIWISWRWLKLYSGIGYFHSDSYDSRVYNYENGPLYTYAISQFYGEGIRYWLMAKANIGKSLSLTAKTGVTDYFDRNEIGTGTQQIAASSQTDLDVQLRWVF